MPNLLVRVRRYAAHHSLWRPATRVVAAVSGGSDSVALFLLLRDLADAGDLVLAGLAHLHHHIRGEAADADARFSVALAARCGVPACVEDEDIPARAARDRVSLEVAGREARQAFFARACAALHADCVSLAHTRDDQAETVLLRLVRGAGPAGLAGMSPRNGARVRPVLTVTRAELREYLEGLGETWHDDATNADCDNPRNRMRHEVLPLLRSAFNPQVDAALARTADILRSDADFFDAVVAEAADRLVAVGSHGVRVDGAGLAALPEAVARRVALRALETVHPGRSYGLEEAIAVCRFAGGDAKGSLPGVEMQRVGPVVVLTVRGQPDASAGLVAFADVPAPQLLPIPGEVRERQGRWVVTSEGPRPGSVSDAGAGDNGGLVGSEAGAHRVMVDAARLGSALLVRTRLPGDRLQPLGASGHRKLQDVLVDRKVPRAERDLVPIVTDSAGQIVWVAGQVLADPFRLTPLTTTVVILKFGRV